MSEKSIMYQILKIFSAIVAIATMKNI